MHRFDNFGSVEVKQLCVIRPPVMDPEYFRDAVTAISAAAGGPPDPGKMAEIFRRHGMTVAATPSTK
jgi:hypothetical protein